MSKLETLECALNDEQRELKEMEELCRIAEKERDEMKVHYIIFTVSMAKTQDQQLLNTFL